MLGERIANLRKAKGISQEGLADILLTSRQAISKWERGESDPDIGRLKDLAMYFNVSIDYLLGYDITSTSVTAFIEKMKQCQNNNEFNVTLDEIRVMVSKNQNNYKLIIAIIDYLSNSYGIKRDKEMIDSMIEYCQKAILLYQPGIDSENTLNDLHISIAECYSLLDQYERAKNYIKENHVCGLENVLAECECELGNYEEAEKITSSTYLKSLTSVISCDLIQIRLFLLTKRVKEALDLTNWSIDFINSIGKNPEIFLDLIFVLHFVKASCEKGLKLDYSDSFNYLMKNRDKIKGFNRDSDGLRFFKNQQITIITGGNNAKDFFLEEIKKVKKSGLDVKSALEIFNKVFNGD